VLDGLDWARHAPTMLLVEDSGQSDLAGWLTDRGYTVVSILNERALTRDLLLRREKAPS